ncbi:hypothetical protein FE257_000381 [Aspergillus nanangensis]|uniref:Xylanolytic transcriptional activator regulatory domain-containing protein n=1 Tax=Aspergillus nanangensis TaxID=2582783 RepID=A0AAD4CUP0_ASPNN|nr:hypothetical protein FE257_000381 [Aspergillus nanangensis]
MTQQGLDFESILDGEDSIRGLNDDASSLKTSPEGGIQNDHPLEENNEGSSKWSAYYQEYQTTDAMLHGSSDEESDRPTIHQAFDTMFSDTVGFPFIAGGSPVNITGSHPSTIQIIQLWQIYIDNINPLLRISHAPTLQGQIIEAGADLSKVSKEFEALMFGIYIISIDSMVEEEVSRIFGEGKHVLTTKYRQATEQSLINAGFMRSSDLKVLQGYLLYLIAIFRYIDPRSMFCLIGIAVRIATRLGLHRDGAQFAFSPLETELRRRLWWQIVALDKRIAEITGSPITALSSSGTDCRLPLNVNDMDLHVSAKEPPPPLVGATEMSFCLTRIEITLAASPTGIRPNPSIINTPESKYSSHTPHNIPANTKTPSTSYNLDTYTAYMESTYLNHCDPKIPIQLFTLMMTRISLCKLRAFNFICRDKSSTMDSNPDDRDAAFLDAIQMLEYDNVIYSTANLRRFLWYTKMQMPIPGYIFLANELCHRVMDESCERAWKAIFENHERRGLVWNLQSQMHMALGHMLLKAWGSREQAELQRGKALETPRLVALLRQRVSQKSAKQKSGSHLDPAGSGAGTGASSGGRETKTIRQVAGVCDENPMLDPTKEVDEIYASSLVDYDQLDWSNLMHAGSLWGGFDGNFNV